MVDLRQAFSDFRQEMRSGIGTCTELLERYIKNSNSFSPRNIGHAASQDDCSPTQQQQILFDHEENTSIEGTPLSTAGDVVNQQQLKPEQQTLATAFFIAEKQNSKGISLSTVFYEWYMREWHTFCFPVRSKEKAIQIQIWKTVAHLKRFLPDNCTITAKPKHNNEDLTSWNKFIRSLANRVQVLKHTK